MAQAEALAQLRDIHLPDPVGWWPPAPGWWLLILLLAAGLAALLWFAWQWHRDRRAKKEALLLLQQYEQQAARTSNSAVICARVSELLRRVALAYYPREKVAALHGDAWIEFLNAHSRQVDFRPVKTLLLETAYQPQSKDDLQPLFTLVRQWIKQRRPKC